MPPPPILGRKAACQLHFTNSEFVLRTTKRRERRENSHRVQPNCRSLFVFFVRRRLALRQATLPFYQS
jgi:hypothetical protein